MEDSLENIEEMELTTPEVMDSWPVVDSIDLGFSQAMSDDGKLSPDRFLHIRLHHRPVHDLEGEETITTYALNPGVIEQIVAGMCSANTTTQDDAQELFDVITGAVAFYRGGHHLHDEDGEQRPVYTDEQADNLLRAIFEAEEERARGELHTLDEVEGEEDRREQD